MQALPFLKTLAPGALQPVYFLWGEESFWVTEIVGKLKAFLVPQDNPEFHYETFEAADSKPADWIAAARTLSFFGGGKLVVVRGLDEGAKDSTRLPVLDDYLQNPVPESCLVLIARKADRKRNLFKKLTALPGAVELTAPRENELIAWLRQRANQRGCQMSAGAARRILDQVGPRPGRLAVELEKLLIYAGKKQTLEEADVAAVVGELRLETVFALTDALRSKQTGRALEFLQNQLDHGEEPLKILGAMAWQFRLIWEVKHHQKQGAAPGRIAAVMGQ
ncbi:MAG: DNA polymerase III subunit delta [Nitrospinaceae bacterium]